MATEGLMLTFSISGSLLSTWCLQNSMTLVSTEALTSMRGTGSSLPGAWSSVSVLTRSDIWATRRGTGKVVPSCDWRMMTSSPPAPPAPAFEEEEEEEDILLVQQNKCCCFDLQGRRKGTEVTKMTGGGPEGRNKAPATVSLGQSPSDGVCCGSVSLSCLNLPLARP